MIARKKLVKTFGITRKTLDHYKDIGLLVPINEDEIKAAKEYGFKPEWQYDDAAFQKLQLIQIFRALDYEPAEIKSFFDNSEFILDDAMDKLLAKKKEIDAMINIVKLLQVTSDLPESAAKAIQNINPEYMWGGRNYSEQLTELKQTMSDSTLFADKDVEWIWPIYQLLFCVIGYQDKGADSNEVQSVLEETYKLFCDTLIDQDNDEELKAHRDEIYTDPDMYDAFYEMAYGLVDDDTKDIFATRYGENCLNFYIEAIDIFKNNHNLNDRKEEI